MSEVRIAQSISTVDREGWNRLFPCGIETFDYLLAVEESGLQGFSWRYCVVEQGGQLLAGVPVFVADYALDTTLTGVAKRLAAAVKRLLPRFLTLRMTCIGSPCTESVSCGFSPALDLAGRQRVLALMIDAIERMARSDGSALVAIKDVAAGDWELWDEIARRRGYGRVPGLPVAWLNVDVDSVDSYLACLSPGTRRDMRRKLRAFASVRVELRSELGSELARAMVLYQQTRDRAQMQFETLTPAYFTAVAARMGERAIYVLYYREDELLAMNLLLQGSDTLLDKFFCMDAETGRTLNLYFLSWFTNLRLCMERGLKRYQSGQAAYENKLRLGSKLTRTAMYFRHRNAVVNGVLRLVSPWFAADATLPRESS